MVAAFLAAFLLGAEAWGEVTEVRGRIARIEYVDRDAALVDIEGDSGAWYGVCRGGGPVPCKKLALGDVCDFLLRNLHKCTPSLMAIESADCIAFADGFESGDLRNWTTHETGVNQ